MEKFDFQKSKSKIFEIFDFFDFFEKWLFEKKSSKSQFEKSKFREFYFILIFSKNLF